MPNVIVSPHVSGDAAGWRGPSSTCSSTTSSAISPVAPGDLVDKTRGYVPSCMGSLGSRCRNGPSTSAGSASLRRRRGSRRHRPVGGRGEVFALLGPNGAGKTTTRDPRGIPRRTSGAVEVLGHDPAKRTVALKERIGIVLQSTGVDPFLTVRETIEMYAGYYPTTRDRRGHRVVGLNEKRDIRVDKLSGGQHAPDVAIAWPATPSCSSDEPTTGSTRARAATPGRSSEPLVDREDGVLRRTSWTRRSTWPTGGGDRKGVDRGRRTCPTRRRCRAMQATVRFRLPRRRPPPDRGADSDRRRLVGPQTDVRPRRGVTGWALARGSSDALEVTQPSLEDVYLELTGRVSDRMSRALLSAGPLHEQDLQGTLPRPSSPSCSPCCSSRSSPPCSGTAKSTSTFGQEIRHRRTTWRRWLRWDLSAPATRTSRSTIIFRPRERCAEAHPGTTAARGPT